MTWMRKYHAADHTEWQSRYMGEESQHSHEWWKWTSLKHHINNKRTIVNCSQVATGRVGFQPYSHPEGWIPEVNGDTLQQGDTITMLTNPIERVQMVATGCYPKTMRYSNLCSMLVQRYHSIQPFWGLDPGGEQCHPIARRHCRLWRELTC